MRKPLSIAILVTALALVWGVAAASGGGRLDPEFGEGGRLMLPSSLEEGEETALLPDGRVIVAGYKKMLALLPSGEIDRGFGKEGSTPFVPPPGSPSATIVTVLVDSRGRLVIVGTDSTSKILIERFTPDGRLDRSFGDGDGFTATDLNLPPPPGQSAPQVLARSATLDSADRIVIGGIRQAGTYFYKGFMLSSYEAFVARLTAEGKQDSSFARSGVLPLPGVEYGGRPVVDAEDGVYFVSGEVLMHLRADGQADPEFGENGGRPLPKGTDSNPVLDPSGRLLLYGYLQGWKEHRLANGVLIKRLLPDGSPDRSFGRRGNLSFRLPRLYTAQLGVDEKGGVLIAAALKRRPQQGRHPALSAGLALLRLRANGDLDSSFGRRGAVQIRFPHSQEANIWSLNVLGNQALLNGLSCPSNCSRALARVELGAP